MESTTKDLKSYTVDANITLTENEQQIFTTLMNVVKAYQLSSTLRVAGGWVRDKVTESIRRLGILTIFIDHGKTFIRH